MALQSLVFEIEATQAEAFSDACLEAGALSVSADDPLAGTLHEVPLYGEPGLTGSGEPGLTRVEPEWPGTDTPAFPERTDSGSPIGGGRWPLARLSVLIEAATNAAQFMAQASRAAGLPTPAFRADAVPEDDWVKKTQAQFQPIRISERLWIVPSWHAAPAPDAINIALDPGVAFGTGSHPTTRLCLQWLERNVRGGEAVLDYGCGSGILAIAAARLGAARVAGVDIDAQAVEAARNNALANAVHAEFFDSAETLQFTADLLVANILSNPLKMLAPALAAHVRPGGRLALSGVLAAQADEVMQTYSQWFDFEPVTELEGWVCLSGRRKA